MSFDTNNTNGSDYAIEVNGLSKCYQIYEKPSDRLKQLLMGERKHYYKEFWALKDVSFKIRKGETVGVIGRNGSGKSTLLQMICGTLNPTAGEINVNGRVAALLELGSGFNPEFTGVENVYMAASLYGLSREQIDMRFVAITAFADIGDHMHQPVKSYSSGMYVRLAFAVIANVDADVLIIDEALAVGDAFFVQKCMRFLREFKERGTLLFVSHDMHSVLGLCSTALLLEEGKVLCAGSPKVVSERYLAELHQDKEAEYLGILRLGLKSETKEDTAAEGLVSSDEKLNLNDFGTGEAKVIAVELVDPSGKALSVVSGGEVAHLKVYCYSGVGMLQPLVGFIVRDRVGQLIFGDNTGLLGDSVNPVESGDSLTVCFEFRMPLLQSGRYVISAAIGEGTQVDHIHHHWKNDALIFDCIPQHRCFGMVAVETLSIRFVD
jgi:lipopolysaccharide transport system ATP-binding protein